MKRRAFLKHLADQGCRVHREGGKHTVVVKPAKSKTSTVPRHTEISDFLVRKVCKDLDVIAP